MRITQRACIGLCAGMLAAASCSGAGVAAEPTLVRHAGGAFAGRTYTNSTAAIERSLSLGARLIEIDLTPTRDGHWHCLHDYREVLPPDRLLGRIDRWLQWWYAKAPRWAQFGLGLLPSRAELSAWVQAQEQAGVPRRCDLDELQALTRRFPDLTLITDTKYDNYQLLDELARIGNRAIVPQVYNETEFQHAAAIGFKRVVFTLYKRGRYAPLRNILGHPSLWKIVMPASWLCPGSPAPPPVWLNDFKGERLVHTVNDPASLCESAMQVDGYYTDWLLPRP
jgi:hypothetical protein